MGIEWYDTYEFKAILQRKMYSRLIGYPARRIQERGILATRHVLNAETGITEETFRQMGVEPRRMALPMVYNREAIPTEPRQPIISELANWLQGRDLTLFTSARLIWKVDKGNDDSFSKNNHFTLLGLKQLQQSRPAARLGMVLVAYGPDVDPTKELIAELGLQESVFWLPKSSRATLMQALSLCDVGVGEYYPLPRTLWGGTGWEAFALGKPLIQGFLFDEGEYEEKFGHPLPPSLLPVRTQKDILPHLLRMLDHPELRQKIGNQSKLWFDKYNGISLAKQWLNLLE